MIGPSDQRDDRQVVTAFVPLANMFGYVGILQAMTGGAGEFTTEYDRHDIVPRFDPEPPGTFPPAIGMRA